MAPASPNSSRRSGISRHGRQTQYGHESHIGSTSWYETGRRIPVGDEIKEQATFPQFEGMTTVGILGRGGQATTYETRMNGEIGLSSRRAVKWYVGTEFGDERFNREVAALHRVNGFEGLPEILLEGVKDGHPWIALNFIDGQSVRERVRKVGALRHLTVLWYGLVLSRALTEVHANGVLHRDINPNNVLLRPALGPPVLIDFGLAILDDSHSQTGQFDVFGTRWFLSPEAERATWSQTPRSDVYSLAATLVFMLVGETPHDVLDPPSPSENGWIQACRNLDNSFLKEALEPCLSDDHASRPTARELHNSLMQAVPGDFIQEGISESRSVKCLRIASHIDEQGEGPSTTEQTRTWTEMALVDMKGIEGLRVFRVADDSGLGEYIGPYLWPRANQDPVLWGPFLTEYCHQHSEFVECDAATLKGLLAQAADQLRDDPDLRNKRGYPVAVSLISLGEYEMALTCIPENELNAALRDLCLYRLGRDTSRAAPKGSKEWLRIFGTHVRMMRYLESLGAIEDAQWLRARTISDHSD